MAKQGYWKCNKCGHVAGWNMPEVDAPSCLSCDSESMQYVESPEPKQDVGPWIVIWKDLKNNLVSCTCEKMQEVKEQLEWIMHQGGDLAATIIPLSLALAAPKMQIALNDEVQLLNELAHEYDKWANGSVKYGWSPHQVKANRDTANKLRRRASQLSAIARVKPTESPVQHRGE